ncbi:unnamed protein product [Prorocentrum cordatum]|uniref:Uncharacterized protein n=1 Tax=Prorocentrum cordatum TaxID=2364126 RepID=A0ABN9WXG2_9DINO|nr:unnamed protein product [Polarella glacialis]
MRRTPAGAPLSRNMKLLLLLLGKEQDARGACTTVAAWAEHATAADPQGLFSDSERARIICRPSLSVSSSSKICSTSSSLSFEASSFVSALEVSASSSNTQPSSSEAEKAMGPKPFSGSPDAKLPSAKSSSANSSFGWLQRRLLHPHPRLFSPRGRGEQRKKGNGGEEEREETEREKGQGRTGAGGSRQGCRRMKTRSGHREEEGHGKEGQQGREEDEGGGHGGVDHCARREQESACECPSQRHNLARTVWWHLIWMAW